MEIYIPARSIGDSTPTVKPRERNPYSVNDCIEAGKTRPLNDMFKERTKPRPDQIGEVDALDLFKQRMARHRGEVSEREIMEAKPETPIEPIYTSQYWEEVYRRRDAESQGQPLPQWIPNTKFAMAPDTIDASRRTLNAEQQCDRQESRRGRIGSQPSPHGSVRRGRRAND